MRQELVHVMAGNVFAISDAQGDIELDPQAPVGLFAFDTRFLSHWVLRIDGERINALSRDDMTYFETRFFLVPGAASHYVDADVSIIRHRSVHDCFHEKITVLNHASQAAEFTVRVEVASDFADIAEVGQLRERDVQIAVDSAGQRLLLSYERERFARETTVQSTAPAEVDEGGMTFRIHIAPGGSWVTDLHVSMTIRGEEGRDLRAGLQSHQQAVRGTMRDDLTDWLDRAPQLVAEREGLEETYRGSLADLAALRYQPLAYSERVPVGGLPWAMALCGRDSIITCLQTMAFTPELAPATLRTLALLQGGQLDDEHDEEPGKILAQLRYGESAAFGDRPTALYYGAADTTPLFVVLLDEYERWSGDADLVRELRHPARMALDWIDEYGDLTGDGYVRYQRRNERDGAINQCWKDSTDAIVDAHGRQPAFPRATCEVQGYAYDAKRRGARLAREFWGDPAYADRLEREAAALKERFNRDFWLPRQEYYALALDPYGEPVDSLSSNIGHLLWSGIVADDRAEAVAEHLVGPRLFSGWGVRTFATGQRAYNPVGAHLGGVWPSDNALIAAGLRHYRFDVQAARIAAGIFDLAQTLRGAVPEVIAGYDRSVTKYPVQLPSAGRPQSWSSGALLMLLGTSLGLRPTGDDLLVNPAVPGGFGRLELLDIPGRWGHSDAYARDRTASPHRSRTT
ncbi:amylo-alpha-1,6-glucosidase [Micromonospora parathelypteridis]|uniref:Glycogen debranching enzyme n=1 Tax=Micromonospora parathelypteridis TaxID=1839617 RepID=A0A840W7Q7_9ACTN|nr:glycogen debranching N-terminal domain-containing protein [Micromonospora parathelypteridis]MBB5480189.1 glycogen debranching enzyme [Micromonospora parathelypteridis]GGO24535.1 amylo-alpha-1,6-glucosidase [Micromonospora parathelypteridis]